MAAPMRLPELESPCADDRLPALAGEWAVGCGPDGRPSVAVHVPTGRRQRWSPGPGPVAWGPGRLVDAASGVLELAVGEWAPLADRLRGAAWAPPGLHGPALVLVQPAALHVLDMRQNGHPVWASRPWGGMAPAVGAGRVVWAVDAGPLGIDLHTRALRGGATAVIAGGPGDQRAPVSDGRAFAWVDRGRLVRWDGAGEPRPLPVLTGFSAPPTLDGGELCAEVRGEGVDIWCSGGGGPAGPGDQTHPSLGGGHLLWREAGAVWVQPVVGP